MSEERQHPVAGSARGPNAVGSVIELQRLAGNQRTQRAMSATLAADRATEQGEAVRQAPPLPVQRLVDVMIQRQYAWANAPAKFRTDNGNAKVPNSEYWVTSDGYMRYAPINYTRAPNQVYHEGRRSFSYLRGVNLNDKAYDYLFAQGGWPKVTAVTGGRVGLDDKQDKNKGKSRPVQAYIVPKEGDTVYDMDVDTSTGDVRGLHPGHAVEDLGKPLPTLDDPKRAHQLMVEQANLYG